MRQARESRHQIFTVVALAALVACAAIAPAIAAAAPGGDEYTLDVPGEGNTQIGGGSSGGGDDDSDASSSVSPATATETTDTTTTDDDGTAAAAGGSGGGGGGTEADKGGNATDAKGGGSGGSTEKPRDNLVAGDTAATDVGSSGSDDGGVPVFLIAIAVVAAICVGVAVWRMRRPGDEGGDRAATREVDTGTQSL